MIPVVLQSKRLIDGYRSFILLLMAENPAPPGMYETLKNNGIFTISTGAGFLPSTVVITATQY